MLANKFSNIFTMQSINNCSFAQLWDMTMSQMNMNVISLHQNKRKKMALEYMYNYTWVSLTKHVLCTATSSLREKNEVSGDMHTRI